MPDNLPQKAEPIAVKGEDQAKLIKRMLQEEEEEEKHREQATKKSETSRVNHGFLSRETRVVTKQKTSGFQGKVGGGKRGICVIEVCPTQRNRVFPHRVLDLLRLTRTNSDVLHTITKNPN